MKRIAVFFATLILLAILITSCGSSEQCAAYGEHNRYKVESR